jgi:hypothetical protein
LWEASADGEGKASMATSGSRRTHQWAEKRNTLHELTQSINTRLEHACEEGGEKKRQTNKYLTESIHQQSSMRGWAKKQPKENTKPTPSSAKEHEERKTNTIGRPTQTTVEQSGNRETIKTHLPPAPPQNTTMYATTEEEGKVQSHLEKPEKKQDKQKYLIRPNG